MPSFDPVDEQRLERVYQRAQRIQLARRFRALAVAVPVLLVMGVGAVASIDPSDGRQMVAVGDGGTTTTAALMPTTTSALVDPSVPTTGTWPHRGTVPPRPPSTVAPPVQPPPPTTMTTMPGDPPQAKWCGYGRGYGYRSVQDNMPPEIEVTLGASPAVVRWGEPMTLTVRARNTSSKAVEYDRGTAGNSFEARPKDDELQVAWEAHPPEGRSLSGPERFEAGEEKVEQVVWRTDMACYPGGGQAGYEAGKAPKGKYLIEAAWNTRWKVIEVEVRP